MEYHFIASFEDEREVLRKIKELKDRGYAEADMYVIARTNEYLTMIRTWTNVDYHAADGKGMGRLGVYIRTDLILPYLKSSERVIIAAAELYQDLEEGKLLFFFSDRNENLEDD